MRASDTFLDVFGPLVRCVLPFLSPTGSPEGSKNFEVCDEVALNKRRSCKTVARIELGGAFGAGVFRFWEAVGGCQFL